MRACEKATVPRGGEPFRQPGPATFSRRPRGQEYRVVADRLVMADIQTLRAFAVIGLLSSLLN